MRGAKPVPSELRNPDSHHKPPQTVLIGGRAIEEEFQPPGHLPNQAIEFWNEVVPMLLDVGLLDRADRVALEMVATSYAMWRMCLLVIAHDGPWVTKKDGSIDVHPAQRQMERWQTQFDRMAEKYALNPVARTRLGLAELASRSLAADLDEKIGAIEGEATEILDADVVVEGESDGLPGS